MTLRFRKSIKLAPGIRWNFSGSGTSWTIGPRGASINIGQRGTYLNTSFWGTGLSERTRIDGPATAGARAAAFSEPMGRTLEQPTQTRVQMTCTIQDDGALTFSDANGAPVSEHFVELAKKQNREALQGLIGRACDTVNERIESLGRLHYDLPDCRRRAGYVIAPFTLPQPVRPAIRTLGFWAGLFKRKRERVEDENNRAQVTYEEASSEWVASKLAHERAERRRRNEHDFLVLNDVATMERVLEEKLQEIMWPRETTVSVDVGDDGLKVLLDVDLPELEDMPTKLAAVPARGLKLSVKELSATKVRQLYAAHVHGILTRLVGEVFAALPTVQTVVASGYSQRRDPATAQLRDDYLLSVRVPRGDWERLDFEHLRALDVIQALAAYELRRDMMKSGGLKAIAPFAA